MTLSTDFKKAVGKIKPVNGVNCAPIISYYNYSLFEKFAELEVPFCRLHDFGGCFGGTHFVDVENIFTDMNADEEDPASYDFTFTDRLLSELDKIGVKPFYRLGASIENGHRIKAYHIYPPKDNAKWARICANIIRHYNCGWADGFHYGIEYFEIWNEPDNEEKIEDNPMWKGTKEQFFEHYKVVSRYLKEQFPEIKVGGYASCGFYAANGDSHVKAANSSPRTEYFIEFFHDFLKFISSDRNRSPLDFFSWHTYASVEQSVSHAEYARRELDRYGFTHTESILNEWNPEYFDKGSAKHASKIGAMLCVMQNGSVDQAEFYAGDLSPWGSFFEKIPRSYPEEYAVTGEFYAFKLFAKLRKLGTQFYCSADVKNVYAVAAGNGKNHALYLVNNSDAQISLDIDCLELSDKTCKVSRTDGMYGFCESDERLTGFLSLPPYSVTLIEA